MAYTYNALKKIVVFCLLAAWPLHVLWAQEMAMPVTHGSIAHDNARITFEWPGTVKFNVVAQGKKITITFARNANPDFGALLSQLYPYVTRAQKMADGKTIVLTLDQPYRIRTFISNNISGIDILNVDPKKRASLQKNTRTADAKVQELATLAPAAGESKPAVEAVAPAKPAEALQTSFLPKPDSAVPPVKLEGDNAAMPLGQIVKAASDPNAPLKINISAAEDNAVLRMPFNERVAMAVFVRAGYVWIVCNKDIKLDLSDFDVLPKTVIGKAQIVPSKQGTVLRIPVSNIVFAAVAREEASFEWAVLLTPKKRPLAKELPVNINTDPPAPAHLFIQALETSDPITLQDPDIGDTLVATPLFRTGEGIAATRQFVEFTLLASAQGIAIVKKSDEVAVIPVREGVRISLPQGATLTPGLPDAAKSTPQGKQTSATLFPYDAWKLTEPETTKHEREARSDLLQAIVGANKLQEANEARLRLAQLYLSEGLAPEAIALLDGINRTDPVFFRSAKLGAMRGAANFLMTRYIDASRDFAATELNNNKEVDYWRNMISDLMGTTGTYDFLSMNDDYISKYPPEFRRRLSIVAADRAIDTKEYNTALKIFDTLHQANLLDSIEAYSNFLLAKISVETGQEKQALEMWDKLADDTSHPFVRSRAEFSRIAWGMDHNTLGKKDVIDRLERLRLAWHGDGLELQILSLLGDLYEEKKDYVNAMRVWDAAVTGFPNTAMAINMAHKLEQSFIVMFNDGGADSLPSLDALALYYQYRNYTPSGIAGTEMIERLADRLVSVDLLDQASLLLDHEMHFQTEKEQRSRLGAKLASIQLLNRQPKKALAALEDSVYGENTLMLRLQRNRLTAESMLELGQPDKALQILGPDVSSEAEQIRTNVFWQKKDWPHLTASVEGLLKNRKDITAPVTLDESEALLKLTLAYIFQNNTTQIQYLHDYFGPLMAANPNKGMFDFLTTSDVALNPTNFDALIKKLSATRTFLDSYHARIEIPQKKPVKGS